MTGKELFFIAAVLASFYFIFSSFRAIQQYDKKIGLSKSQRNFLYSITIFVPILGFMLTRSLQKQSV